VILRPFNNYGPKQHLEKCVPRFITAALLGEPLTLHGGGEASRDWLHVDDCVDGVLAALDTPIAKVRGRVVNLGTGVATPVSEIARHVVEISGRADLARETVGERPGQVHRHIAAARLAKTLLGWSPKTSLRDGLASTFSWYRDHRDWWEPLRWMRHVRVRLPDGKVELH
jgi:dTDP-glucose 4,6-dehydratase